MADTPSEIGPTLYMSDVTTVAKAIENICLEALFIKSVVVAADDEYGSEYEIYLDDADMSTLLVRRIN